jgi:hypothetical protein
MMEKFREPIFQVKKKSYSAMELEEKLSQMGTQ